MLSNGVFDDAASEASRSAKASAETPTTSLRAGDSGAHRLSFPPASRSHDLRCGASAASSCVGSPPRFEDDDQSAMGWLEMRRRTLDQEVSATESPPRCHEEEHRTALGWLEAASPAQPPVEDGSSATAEEGRWQEAAARPQPSCAQLCTAQLLLLEAAAAEAARTAAAFEKAPSADHSLFSSPGAESCGSAWSPRQSGAAEGRHLTGDAYGDASSDAGADESAVMLLESSCVEHRYADEPSHATDGETSSTAASPPPAGARRAEDDRAADGSVLLEDRSRQEQQQQQQEVAVQAVPSHQVKKISDAAGVSQAPAAAANPKWQRVNGKWAFC